MWTYLLKRWDTGYCELHVLFLFMLGWMPSMLYNLETKLILSSWNGDLSCYTFTQLKVHNVPACNVVVICVLSAYACTYNNTGQY